MLARVQTRIGAAGRLPLIDVDRNAGALADRADIHIAIIDVPSDMVRIIGAAAGQMLGWLWGDR
jgi:hypothetical protein